MNNSVVLLFGAASAISLSSCKLNNNNLDHEVELHPLLSEGIGYSIYFTPDLEITDNGKTCFMMGGVVYLSPGYNATANGFSAAVSQSGLPTLGIEGLSDNENSTTSYIQGTFNNQGYIDTPAPSLGNWGEAEDVEDLLGEFITDDVDINDLYTNRVSVFEGNLLEGGTWQGSFGLGNEECSGTWFLDFDSSIRIIE